MSWLLSSLKILLSYILILSIVNFLSWSHIKAFSLSFLNSRFFSYLI